jgi:hypothetical protein
VPFNAGGVAKSYAEVGFTEPDTTEEDDVGFVLHELKAKEIFDL